MVSRCANAECGAPFHYLREGKLFKFEVASHPPEHAVGAGTRLVTTKKSPTKIEHFWLCGNCSRQMTLRYQHATGVVLIHLDQRAWNATAS